MKKKDKNILKLIKQALVEDIGSGDATTEALVAPHIIKKAVILAKTDCVVCGTNVAKQVFEMIDPTLQCVAKIRDGKAVKRGTVVMELNGKARTILTGERTALNFMQHLSGIATMTSHFVRIAKKFNVQILDTRKTTPTLRKLEKYAVRCGGGTNHRMGLYDMILIKDNHRKLLGCKTLAEAIEIARAKYPALKIEIEVESPKELKDALRANPDWVLLDNMPAALVKKCVKLCGKLCKTEASGGINFQNIRQYVRTGITAISLGCLTHSVVAADLSLEIVDG
jgi:nicotinate-nucleotide pyrophosphorylase (carboxylating)